MTHPAEVTNRLDWADLNAALQRELDVLDALIESWLDEHHPDQDDAPDRDPEFELTSDAEDIEADRTRTDFETDFDLDGDFDGDGDDEVDPPPELETS